MGTRHIRYGKKRRKTAADRLTDRTGGDVRGCCGNSDCNSDRGGDNDRRGMILSSCQEIAVAVAATGFGPAAMMEWISI